MNIFDMGKLAKQAKEVQANMKKAQEELAKKKVQGKAGGDAVIVEMNGQYQCLNVLLSEEARKEEPDMLQALITAAVNDAVKKVQDLTQSEMSGALGGFNLPAGFKFPF